MNIVAEYMLVGYFAGAALVAFYVGWKEGQGHPVDIYTHAVFVLLWPIFIISAVSAVIAEVLQ